MPLPPGKIKSTRKIDEDSFSHCSQVDQSTRVALHSKI
jgi:hypothetical protein